MNVDLDQLDREFAKILALAVRKLWNEREKQAAASRLNVASWPPEHSQVVKMTGVSGRPEGEGIKVACTVCNRGSREMTKATGNTGKPWIQSDIAMLRMLAKGNTPTRVIGLKLNRTEAAVRAKASELNISLKPTNQSPYNRRGKVGR